MGQDSITQSLDKKNIVEPLTVSKAMLAGDGPCSVKGIVVSVGQPYKKEIGEEEYLTARNVQLQDENPNNELDRLDVILFNHNIEGVIAGELVIVEGRLSIEKVGRVHKNVLSALNIEHTRKQESPLTNEEITNFKEFAKLPHVIKNLTAMFAPQVIGHEDVKRGILRSVVGGVEVEDVKRGRVNSLLVGSPGESKTMLTKEATKIVPNSNFNSATHASGKSLIAIVDKEGDNKVLRIGPVPLAKGAICGINEIGTLPYEDQNYLLDIMEEGKTTIHKHGVNIAISAPTTIIATANPIGANWKDQHNATLNELPLLKTLIDRTDQVFIFKNTSTEAEDRKYAELKPHAIKIKPDYGFLIKYIQYAKTLNPEIPNDVSRYLADIWIQLRKAGLGTKRTLDGLYRLVEAQARLHLSDRVTLEIADEVIDDVRGMLKAQNAFNETLTDPKEIAVAEIVKVVKDLKGESILFQEATKAAIQNSEKVRAYLGTDLTARDNVRYRRVQEAVIENTPEGIKITQKKPLVVACDLCDPCDRPGTVETSSN